MSKPCKQCRYAAYCLPTGGLPAIRIIRALRASRGFGLREAKDYLSLTVPRECTWAKAHQQWIQSADPSVLSIKPPALITTYLFNFAEDIPANTPVCIDHNGRIQVANARQSGRSRVLGVLLEDALSGVPCDVAIASHGIVAGALGQDGVDVPVGSRVFLGYMGGYTYLPPHQASNIVCLGFALNDTDLWVQIHDYGKRT
jgi:hypothetical protein